MTAGNQANAPLRIATRRSRLALVQANLIANHIRQHTGRETELVPVTSTGDAEAHRPLREIGGKGVFVKELEQALIDDHADLAVHSLKDVPSRLAPEFTLAAVGWREDARDAFLSHERMAFSDLPAGARIGTSSLRRKLLLEKLRPDLLIEPMRGNVDTRIGKLQAGECQGLVLAVAGLSRLGLTRHVVDQFSVDQLLPAPGQGMLGVEVLSERQDLIRTLSKLVAREESMIGRVERRVSELLDGDCNLPIAAHGEARAGGARLRVWIASNCGSLEASAEVGGVLALELADQAVDRLLASGGRAVMASFS